MSDLLNDNTKTNPPIPFRFTRLYVTLLVVLAGLLTAAQVLTQWRLSSALDELWIIRYTALQRHQSQQIVKQALQLIDPSERANFTNNVAELRQVFSRFERYHVEVRSGRVTDHDVTIPNTDTVQRLFEGIRPEFEAFQKSARLLMTLQRPDEVSRPDIQASLKMLLANEKPFLEEIDAIVREYTGELRNKLNLLQFIEFALYCVAIAALLGIGLLILRPAGRKLRQTIAQLVEAESQTTAANRQLLSVNQSLKEARRKLFEATKQQYQQQRDEQKLRTSYLITGQEDERKRLSRELHDGLGQMLTAIKLQIEGLDASLKRTADAGPDGSAPYAKNMGILKKLVTQTIQETRTISNNLMPTVLSDFGVVPAIKMLAENDRTSALDVTFETNVANSMSRWDKNVEIMLYRITQEAVSNAVKHADPTHIHIDLIERERYIHLFVSDDGRGFRPNEQQTDVNRQSRSGRAPSQGLHNMQERAALLNGKFRISSEPGKGTKIHVSIPYQMQSAHYDVN